MPTLRVASLLAAVLLALLAAVLVDKPRGRVDLLALAVACLAGSQLVP